MKHETFPTNVNAETVSLLLGEVEACTQKHAEQIRLQLSDIADAGVRYGYTLASYEPDGARPYSAEEMRNLQESLRTANALLNELCNLVRRFRNEDDPFHLGIK